MSQPMPTFDDLMQALDFSEDELAVNRAGHLSDEQLYRMNVRRRRLLAMLVLGFIAFAFLATVFIFFGQRDQAVILSFSGVIITVLNAVYVGFIGRYLVRLSGDIASDRVASLTGPVERVIRPNGQVNNYILRIENMDFSVKKEIFAAVRHQGHYHFYCTPFTRTLLSAEPA